MRLLPTLLLMAMLQAPGSPDQGIFNARVTNAAGTEGIREVSVLLVGPLAGAAANAATSNPLMIEEIAQGSGTPTARLTSLSKPLRRTQFRAG